MVELAEIFRRHGAQYRSRYQNRLPFRQLRAMRDIQDCRTPVLGGQIYACAPCGEERYSYHSCKNRHCPKCQSEQAELQKELLLPVPYFLVTATLPSELRPLAGKLPRTVYRLLLKAASAALLKLARDRKYLGGIPGVIAVLHTWKRDLLFHPHVHFLVTGGGVAPDGKTWRWTAKNYLVNVQALSSIFRAKFRHALAKAGLCVQIPPRVWEKEWVVHAKAVGNGEAALKYLTPYIFRIAITNNRIEKLEDCAVTFRYKENKTKQWKRCALEVGEFIRRFLQHVLPKRFIKVRYYGLFSARKRRLLDQVRLLLKARVYKSRGCRSAGAGMQPKKIIGCRCPKCGNLMTPTRILLRETRGPP